MAADGTSGLPDRRSWHGRVWRIAGPIMLANISTPLLGAVDTAVVGQLPDPANIGAVAVGAIIFSFLFWGFGFLRMGTSGFTSQAFGAGDKAELRAALARPVILALLLAGLLLLLQWPIRDVALWAMSASPGVEGLTAVYFDIRIWSAPAALVNFALLGWLLGTQRAAATLVLTIILNGLNILLDLLFVLGFGWGVAGVAGATVIAEIVTAACGLLLIARLLAPDGGIGRATWDRARILQRAAMLRLLKVNGDLFLRTLCLLFAFAAFTSESGRQGDVILAANAILMHFFSMAAYGLDGFAFAAEVLAGSALGARDRGAFRAAVVAATLWAIGLSVLVTLVYLVAGPPIIALFSDNEDVRREAAIYLPWVVALPLVGVWPFLLDGIFIGATRSGALRNAMALSLAVYLAALWLLQPPLGNHGLWLSMHILMIARTVTLAVCYPALERSVAPQAPCQGARQAPD